MNESEQREEKTRAFIAAEIDLPVISRIEALVSKLKRTEAGVKWVRPQAMHITLRFLGNISREEIGLAQKAMDEAVRHAQPVEVEIKGFGTFPKNKRPRVLWLGLSSGGPELCALFEKLESSLSRQGFGPADKPFSAHLTLGRVKSGSGLSRAMKVLESEAGKSFGRFRVERLILYRSRLHPTGAQYSVLAESLLGEGAGSLEGGP